MTTSEPTFGPMLRAWRAARGKSQLALALEAGVSTRHLSFVETGRSTPSREMILAPAVPLRERNARLEAAGFAAVYRETPLDAPVMAEAKDALGRILDSHLPNPALALNRRSDVLLANAAAVRVIGHLAREYRGKMNVASLLVGERGLRKAIVNWREVTWHARNSARYHPSRAANRDALRGRRDEPSGARRNRLDVTSEVIEVRFQRPHLHLVGRSDPRRLRSS
jgi:transcriptional regulator with XRE-family HTH domain